MTAKPIVGTFILTCLLTAMDTQAAPSTDEDSETSNLRVCHQSSIPVSRENEPTLTLDIHVTSRPDKEASGEARIITFDEEKQTSFTTISGL